ncbi:unnamed protein product, partial [Staurois parvus]
MAPPAWSLHVLPVPAWVFSRYPDAPGTFFIGFFEFGQGHRGPMIPYCPGAP